MKVAPKTVVLKDGRKLILRSPLPSEADLMLQHLRISHAESYKNLINPPSHWEAFPVAEEEKVLIDFNTSENKFMLSAFSEHERIVGGLGLFGTAGQFVKHNARLGMSIRRSFCNSGLGTEMMKYALEIAKQNGFHRVELTVRTHNPSGIALYEKIGFERVGLLRDVALIDGEYADEYLYQLIL